MGGNHKDNRENNVVDYMMMLVEGLPYQKLRQYTIIADQFFGHEETADKLHEQGFKFILSCQATRPTCIFKDYLHVIVKNQGKY